MCMYIYIIQYTYVDIISPDYFSLTGCRSRLTSHLPLPMALFDQYNCPSTRWLGNFK